MTTSIWIYEDEQLETVPEEAYGFIYKINYTDGTAYVGKKNFYTEVQLPSLKSGEVRPNALRRLGKMAKMSKEELAVRTPAQLRADVKTKRVEFDVVRKESAWKKYKGSTKLAEGKTIANKEILLICSSKRELTYMECKALFMLEVLEDDTYLNENILAKFFKGNLR